jgi:TatD DNase family protein
VPEEHNLDLVDTHCHLNLDEFNPDRDLVIDEARRVGITKILIPGIDIESSKSAIEIANQSHGMFAAVGIHPNRANEWTENSISELRILARNHKVKAIGEIGLDYYRDYSSKEKQRYIFQEQLYLATELNLPVIIHNRDASHDVLGIVTEWHQENIIQSNKLTDLPGVFHSFSGNLEFADAVLDKNFKIGIDGPITYKNSKYLQYLVGVINIDNLLIETDAPYLTPHPFRGKRNVPANVRIVVEKIAEIKQIPSQTIASITSATAEMIFRWSETH